MLDQIISELCKRTKINKAKLVFIADSTYVRASAEKNKTTIERYKTEYLEGITIRSSNHDFFDIDITTDIATDINGSKEYQIELKIPAGDVYRLKEYILKMDLFGEIYCQMKEKAQKLRSSDDPHYAEMIIPFAEEAQKEAAKIVCHLLKFKDIDFVQKKKEKKSPKESTEELDIS